MLNAIGFHGDESSVVLKKSRVFGAGLMSFRVLCGSCARVTVARQLPSRRAERQNFAVRTSRHARRTAPTPVPYQPMAKQRPKFSWHELFQVAFDLLRGGLSGETQALREPRDMRVNHDSLVNAKGVA